MVVEVAERTHPRSPALLSLDDPRSNDPAVSGAKGAWLARGIEAGLPILPGLVVTAAVSRPHMAIGADALSRRGSGGARLEVSQQPLADPLPTELARMAAELGDPLVVRSSSVLEGGAEWSGAFTSYLEVHPEEVARAVAGCWASAFGVSTLERHIAADTEPGSAPMAVLIQPALDPDFGGVARLEGEDVLVVAVEGSPAPLVQGWEPGVQARVPSDGAPLGAPAVDLMGGKRLEAVAGILREAQATTGATACEWAISDDGVCLLQLMRPVSAGSESAIIDVPGLEGDPARDLARLARRYPGPLGESLVLPWAVGDPTGFLDPVPAGNIDPTEALAMATQDATTLTAEVWSLPKPKAVTTARRLLRDVRGSDPATALERLGGLRRPDPDRANLVLGLLATVRSALVKAGAVTWPEIAWHFDPSQVGDILAGRVPVRKRDRIGFDRWEPFDAAVTVAGGRWAAGTSAAPGIASGRLCHIPDSGHTDHFRPRDVVVAPHPTPNLAPLLWDAAALVTTGGGPGAHLFGSARALAIPAVCGVRLDEAVGGDPAGSGGCFALAVDGTNGAVYAREW